MSIFEIFSAILDADFSSIKLHTFSTVLKVVRHEKMPSSSCITTSPSTKLAATIMVSHSTRVWKKVSRYYLEKSY